MAGLVLLRAAPLLAATSYVTFTFCEDTFVRGVVHTAPSAADKTLRRHANRILPGFITDFTRRGLPFIFLTYPLSIATATANARRDGTDRTAAAWYLAGLAFSLLHFPFGPTSMSYMTRVGEDQGAESDPHADNTAHLGSWLRLNAWRGVVADVPSWVCYGVAFTLAMS